MQNRRRRHRVSTIAREIQLCEPRTLLSATVTQYGDKAYFVSETAAQIERYDLTSEAWLSPVPLTEGIGLPTVVHVDADGLYVASGQTVYRYELDGSNGTHIMNGSREVSDLMTDGNMLIVAFVSGGNDPQLIFYDKTDNSLLNDSNPWHSRGLTGWSLSPQTNRAFARSVGVSPSDIHYREYTDDGQVTQSSDSRYHGDFPSAYQTWVFSDGSKVIENSGTVYSTDGLSYAGTVNSSFDDVTFLGDEIPIVLRDNTVTAYSRALLPTGSATVGINGDHVFLSQSSAIVFAQTDAGWDVDSVLLSSLNPPEPGAPVDPDGLAYTPGEVYLATNGNVLLFSQAHQSVFEWDPERQRYVDSIPLIGAPEFMTYSEDLNRVYLAYQNGLIRQIDLDAEQPAEVPFASLPQNPMGLQSAGEYLFAVDPSGAWVSHYTFSPDGEMIDNVEWNYFSHQYVWSETNQKMYFFRDSTSPRDILWEEINENGVYYPEEVPGGIRNKKDSPLHSSTGMTHPIHLSPDGNLVLLGSGVFHNSTTLERLTTSLANNITDAAWLGDTLFTLTPTSYQRWEGSSYQLTETQPLTGTAHTLMSLTDDRMLSIVLDEADVPQLTIRDAELNVVPPVEYELTLDGEHRFFESSASHLLTIHRDSPTDAPLEVQLWSSDPSRLTVPAAVTIPAGAASVQVAVTPVDNAASEGSQVVRVRATVADHATADLRLSALDNEPEIIHTDGATIAGEDGTSDQIGVRLPSAPTSDVIVHLDGDEISTPRTLVFNASNWDQIQYAAVGVHDNEIPDGDRPGELLVSVDPATIDAVFAAAGTQSIEITVLDNEPPQPHITGPFGTVDTFRPVLTWRGVEGASQYDIWLEREGDEDNPGRFTTTATSFSAWRGGSLPFGRYKVWVQAEYAEQPASAWDAGEFVVGPRTEIADLTSMRDVTTPLLEWSPLAGVTSYELWVGNQTTGQSAIIHRTDLTEPRFQVEEPLGFGAYGIWVRGIGPDGTRGRWSAAAQHYVGSNPIHSHLTTLSNQPEFTWTDVDGAASYSLWISGPNGQVIQAADLTEPSYTHPDPLVDGRYRWWVLPVTANGRRGRWSRPASVYVGGGRMEFSRESPRSDSTPLISWNDVAEAASYRFFLFSASQQKVVLDESGLTASQLVTPFLLDGEYTIWVQATDENGETGRWSQPHTLTMDTATSGIQATPIESNVSSLEDEVTLSWTATSVANAFDVYATDGEQTYEFSGHTAKTLSLPVQTRGRLVWRVRALYGVNVGAWSDEAIIDTTGRVTILSSPGTVATPQPTIFWKRTAGATHYVVFVRNLDTGVTVVRDDNVEQTSFQTPALSDNRYRIWIQAIGPDGLRGTWSLPLDLTVQTDS